ncbi:hypothetical protein HBI32_047170 [Parastagonospora nodorum]|nr:hypothetical protein HBI32_047170 [Parastagonospora nodorum]
MDLDDDQTLEIDLAMYRKAGKTTRDRPDQNIYDRIDLCLITLKDNPYVNILDLVDTYRTGRPICTFDNWNEFKRYTLRGRRMDMEVANQNEVLAPLLQDFRRGPMAVDPRRTRRQFVSARAPTKLPPPDATLTDAVPEASVSRPATQVIDLTQDDEPSQSPRLSARTLAKASSLGKRLRESSPRVVVPSKRACVEMHADFLFYPELPLAQAEIRHFFRPSILA